MYVLYVRSYNIIFSQNRISNPIHIYCKEFIVLAKMFSFDFARLNYMWKHLNSRDKHKYYETATKARAMYSLPDHPYTTGI